MRKFSVLTTGLLIAGVLATMGFTHPLAVRNGVVSDYSAGSSITIHSSGTYQTYALRGTNGIFPQNMASGLGAGARVTVFAQCFGNGQGKANNNGLGLSAPVTGNTTTNATGTTGMTTRNGANGNGNMFRQANQNYCVALAILVRAAATGGTIPATGGTGGTTATGTSTPSTGAAGATSGTNTPAAGTTSTTGGAGAVSGTSTPAAGVTGGTATTSTETATATATPMCVTATPTLAAGVATATMTVGGTTTPFVLCTPTPSVTPTP